MLEDKEPKSMQGGESGVSKKPSGMPHLEIQTTPSSEVMLQEYLNTARQREVQHEIEVVTERGDFINIDGMAYEGPDRQTHAVQKSTDPQEYPRRLAEVGKYDINGGKIAFVDENGSKHIGIDNDNNVKTLEEAGYKRGFIAVEFSHGEEPIKEEDKEEFRKMEKREKARRLEEFIQVGLTFLKAGEHERAIRFFTSPDMASRMGFAFNEDPRVWILQNTPSREDVERIVSFCADESSFDPMSSLIRKETPLLTLSAAQRASPDIAIPTELSHNIALLHAEEWLHGLQFLRGENNPLDEGIANLSLDPNKVNIREVDVALFLHKNGVPLTSQFLGRYGGDRARAIYGVDWKKQVVPDDTPHPAQPDFISTQPDQPQNGTSADEEKMRRIRNFANDLMYKKRLITPEKPERPDPSDIDELLRQDKVLIEREHKAQIINEALEHFQVAEKLEFLRAIAWDGLGEVIQVHQPKNRQEKGEPIGYVLQYPYPISVQRATFMSRSISGEPVQMDPTFNPTDPNDPRHWFYITQAPFNTSLAVVVRQHEPNAPHSLSKEKNAKRASDHSLCVSVYVPNFGWDQAQKSNCASAQWCIDPGLPEEKFDTFLKDTIFDIITKKHRPLEEQAKAQYHLEQLRKDVSQGRAKIVAPPQRPDGVKLPDLRTRWEKLRSKT